ncbi:hypothetical protein BM1_03712 [Bipolaris maydis]|nr:hypothetical protein BM1_03712 [Bipolaris maydis]
MARKEKASRKTGVAGWEPWQMVVVHDTGAVESEASGSAQPRQQGPPHKHATAYVIRARAPVLSTTL